MPQDGLLEQILEKCTTIETVQLGLPNEDRVRVIIREEQRNCPAFVGFGKVADRAAENTGTIRTLLAKGARTSIVPAARAAANLPLYLKILIPIVLALVGALLGIDLGVK